MSQQPIIGEVLLYFDYSRTGVGHHKVSLKGASSSILPQASFQDPRLEVVLESKRNKSERLKEGDEILKGSVDGRVTKAQETRWSVVSVKQRCVTVDVRQPEIQSLAAEADKIKVKVIDQ